MRAFHLIGLVASMAVALALPGGVALAQEGLKPQSNAAQGVTVKVVPADLSASSKQWAFRVTFDTHSQDLTDDLMKSTALIADGGRRYAPKAWQGDGPGGHHRNGTLVFDSVAPRPQTVELQLQRAGEAAPRSFRWQLQ